MIGRRSLIVLLVPVALASACASGTSAPAGGPRALSPDSAALLAAAIAVAQPAFQTQAEALASTHYAHGQNLHGSASVATPERRPAGSGHFIIQVAAYRELYQAEMAADLARRRFPGLDVVIEAAPDLVRVAIGGWPSSNAAQAMLGTVRSYYPDAWVRSRVSP